MLISPSQQKQFDLKTPDAVSLGNEYYKPEVGYLCKSQLLLYHLPVTLLCPGISNHKILVGMGVMLIHTLIIMLQTSRCCISRVLIF